VVDWEWMGAPSPMILTASNDICKLGIEGMDFAELGRFPRDSAMPIRLISMGKQLV
jgi:hypothetical protein